MENRRKRRGRCRRNPRNRKIQRRRRTDGGDDIINSMPDEILHHILSFVPIELAVRSCVLSKRWRHVWCETPALDINESKLKAGNINQNLISYTPKNITSFKLRMGRDNSAAEVDSWLEFAISRNVQKLSVGIYLSFTNGNIFSFGDLFYVSSSFKQLSICHYYDMNPRCVVSWKSLRELSLRNCDLGDESMANILSGCPILESLTLDICGLLEHLDLSKSPSLRRLKIDFSRPIEIVAPHIHYLSLKCYEQPSTLVDVSSLTEANLNIYLYIGAMENHHLQTMALAKSHNVERLTLGPTNFLRILSLAEIRGIPLPTLKVQTLIIKTSLVRSIIPGIARLLQNSPGLKTLRVDMMKLDLDKTDMDLDSYSDSQVLNSDQCWRSEYEVFATSKEMYTMLGCNEATSKLLVSFMELVLRNAKTLERMVVWLGGIYLNEDEQWFEELLQLVATLSHHNNVSIVVLKRNNYLTTKKKKKRNNYFKNKRLIEPQKRIQDRSY